MRIGLDNAAKNSVGGVNGIGAADWVESLIAPIIHISKTHTSPAFYTVNLQYKDAKSLLYTANFQHIGSPFSIYTENTPYNTQTRILYPVTLQHKATSLVRYAASLQDITSSFSR
jgi:hypothetical protein